VQRGYRHSFRVIEQRWRMQKVSSLVLIDGEVVEQEGGVT